MRGTGRRLLLCAMVLGVISGLCTGAGTAWASQAVLEGHVVDSFRAPVAGVQVHVWDGRATHTAVTNAEGMFSLVGLTMDRDLSVRWVRKGQRDVRLDGVRLRKEGTTVLNLSYGDTRVGGDVVVRLASNPSTGYGWTVSQSSDPKVAVLSGSLFEPPGDPSNRGRAGASGSALWIFHAVGKGASTMVFRYARSWEDLPPLRTHVYALTVK